MLSSEESSRTNFVIELLTGKTEPGLLDLVMLSPYFMAIGIVTHAVLFDVTAWALELRQRL